MAYRIFPLLGAVGGLALSAPLLATDPAGDDHPASMESAQSGQYSLGEIANPPVDYQTAAEVGSTDSGDGRAKAAWLEECRRRANLHPPEPSPLGTTQSAANQAKEVLTGHGQRSYDYCEAYLDDYYRNYSQAGLAYSYGSQGTGSLPQPGQLTRGAATQGSEEPYEEIITEEYVPVRSRSSGRSTVTRVAHDKRVRIR
jgi:hypothetical protein